MEVVSDNSVRFTLNAPYAPFLSNLAYPTGLIASPEAIKNNGSDFGRNPVGTGAFRFNSWKANEAVIVDRNDNYWDENQVRKQSYFVQLLMVILE